MSSVSGRIEELEEERERLNTKCQSQEDAVAVIHKEESTLKARIQGLQDDGEQLASKCKSQENVIVMIRRESELNDDNKRQAEQKTGSAIQEMAARIKELEDEHERLTAKCTAPQAGRIAMTEKENKQKDTRKESEQQEV